MGMRACTIAVVGALAVLCGCAQLRVVDLTGSDESLAEVNEVLSGRAARIVWATGDEFLGVRVHVRPDSTKWLTQAAMPERMIAQTSELRTITVLDHGRGARRGAILGGAVGALVGLYFVVETTSGPSSYGDFEGFAVLIPIGGVAGAALGAAVGGYVGSERTFVFGSGVAESASTKSGSRRRR